MALKTLKGLFSNSDPEIEKRNPVAFKRARAWRMTENLWIYGHIGAGKTFLAECLLDMVQQDFNARVLFASAQMILRWNQKDSPNTVFPVAQVRGVLAVDDIDKLDPRLIPRFYELMEARSRKALPTIVTANTSNGRSRSFFEKHSPDNPGMALAAFDRLKPLSVIELRGKSLREDGKAENEV